MTAMVQRETQTALPASSTMRMSQTCVVRPRWIGRAVPRDPARAHAAQVIGVDLEPDANFRLPIDAGVGGVGRQRFRQHHGGAAVQDAERLMRALVDRHAPRQKVVADFDQLDAEVLDQPPPTEGLGIQRRRTGPDRPGGCPAHGRAARVVFARGGHSAVSGRSRWIMDFAPRQAADVPPSTFNSLAVVKRLSSLAR